MDNIFLANEFPAFSDADWRDLVDKALAGVSFDSLRTSLHEGIETEPFYTAQNSPQTRLAAITHHRSWEIIQPIIADGTVDAKAQFADCASAVCLEFDGGISGTQLPLQTVSDFEALCSDLANPIGSYYLSGSTTIAPAAIFAAYIEQEPEVNALGIGGSTGFDPLTEVAISGEISANRNATLADSVDAAFFLKDKFPAVTPFLASDRAWHGAGGSATQELAFTLAAAVAYWKALNKAGMSVEESAYSVGFRLTASADIFLTIAKFRALRLLWQKALESAGLRSNADLKIVAETSYRMLSEYDSHANLLRGTSAAFGAAIGGATAILVHPYDIVTSEPGTSSMRLARNTSLILQHEANLKAVGDAAAGSYYVETLTDALAEESWTLFRKVEAKGGLAAALESGFLQTQVSLTRTDRNRSVAQLKDKITGVSAFPNLEEAAMERDIFLLSSAEPTFSVAAKGIVLPPPGKGERFLALVSAAKHGASLVELQSALRSVKDILGKPLSLRERSAEPFEALRRQSDLALARLGSRPPIFLALFGEEEDYRECAAWVQSFFAIGGIEAVIPERGSGRIADLVAAFKENPSPIACLCSSSSRYAEIKGAASELKKAGAAFVYMAAPTHALENIDPLDAAAIDRLLHKDSDALAIFQEAHGILRVSELAEQPDEDGEL